MTLKQTDHMPRAQAGAARILSAIHQRDVKVNPKEFEVRWPGSSGAVGWHTDNRRQSLTCLTTLQGEGTQFVSPETVDKKFGANYQVTGFLAPKEGEAAIAADIRSTKPGKFYFFAAEGLDAPEIPKLVHRAPAGNHRATFMARWTEEK